MLQKKEYQQQQRYQCRKSNLPVTTKPNVTKEGIPTTTIKKPIIENQTSSKIKTNVTKEGIPTTTKIPSNTNKTNVTKEGIPTTPQN